MGWVLEIGKILSHSTTNTVFMMIRVTMDHTRPGEDRPSEWAGTSRCRVQEPRRVGRIHPASLAVWRYKTLTHACYARPPSDMDPALGFGGCRCPSRRWKRRAETIFHPGRFLKSRLQDGPGEPHIRSDMSPRMEISCIVLESQGPDCRLVNLLPSCSGLAISSTDDQRQHKEPRPALPAHAPASGPRFTRVGRSAIQSQSSR